MLVNPNSNQVKLIDFGLAKKYNPNETIQVLCGTPEFIGTSFLFTHLFTYLVILVFFRNILYVGYPDIVDEEFFKIKLHGKHRFQIFKDGRCKIL